MTLEELTESVKAECKPRIENIPLRLPSGAVLIGYATIIQWEDGRTDATWYRPAAGAKAGYTIEQLAAALAKARPAREPKKP